MKRALLVAVLVYGPSWSCSSDKCSPCTAHQDADAGSERRGNDADGLWDHDGPDRVADFETRDSGFDETVDIPEQDMEEQDRLELESSLPEQGGVAYDIDSKLVLEFDSDLDPSSIHVKGDARNVFVQRKDPEGWMYDVPVRAAVDSNVLELEPIQGLSYSSDYVIRLEPGIMSKTGSTLAAEVAISFRSARLYYQEDFEDPYVQHITTVFGDNDIFETGIPTSGPGRSYQGVSCLATVLDGDYRAEDIEDIGADRIGYVKQGSIMLKNVLDLTAVQSRVHLKMWHWFDFAYVKGTDESDVEIVGGQVCIYPDLENPGPCKVVWPVGGSVQGGGPGGYARFVDKYLPAFAGNTNSEWYQEAFDITAYKGTKVAVGFNLFVNSETSTKYRLRPGWYIDLVQVVEAPPEE